MKAFSVAGGVVGGLILAFIGFLMVGPGGSNSYATPVQLGGLSVFALPLGYFALVSSRASQKIVGFAALAAIVLVLLAAWAPLTSEAWMREVHGPLLTAWSVVWLLAAVPFALAAVRK